MRNISKRNDSEPSFESGLINNEINDKDIAQFENEFSESIVKVEGGFIDLDFRYPKKRLGLVLKIKLLMILGYRYDCHISSL